MVHAFLRAFGSVLLMGIGLFCIYLAASEINFKFFNTNPRSPQFQNTHLNLSETEKSAAIQSILDKIEKDDDPALIQLIRDSFLIPPSKEHYNLKEPENINPSMGQAQAIDYVLKGKKNGFYVECGGLDGELRSNTLYFEREKAWKGLVIEADPLNFAEMKEKHRKAYISPSCLATTNKPAKVVFAQSSNRGHIYDVDTYDDAPATGLVNVQCFPLYSYMLALNVTTIDYFSLDVEGAEFKVLQTIPWDKLDIKTLSVEYFHDAEGKAGIKKYMLNLGYEIYTEVTNSNNLANDFIFVKKEFMS